MCDVDWSRRFGALNLKCQQTGGQTNEMVDILVAISLREICWLVAKRKVCIFPNMFCIIAHVAFILCFYLTKMGTSRLTLPCTSNVIFHLKFKPISSNFTAMSSTIKQYLSNTLTIHIVVALVDKVSLNHL